MRVQFLTPVALAILLPALQAAAQVSLVSLLYQPFTYTFQTCGAKLPNCAAGLTCVKSGNNQIGVCKTECSLTTDQLPCPAGQQCRALPQPSTQQFGYCSGKATSTPPKPATSTAPEPATPSCGGFIGKDCEGEDEECIDDPSDDCDPMNGGSDCPGICVARCGGSTGSQCEDAYTCVDNPKDDCDPWLGGVNCSGLCVLRPEEDTQRLCDSRGLPPCLQGETCVHDMSNSCGAASDCPGFCMVV